MKHTLREVVQYLGILAGAGAVVLAARTAEAGDVSWLLSGNGFKEECIDEGCSREESSELYRNGDYDEECLGEGCSLGEKIELACGAGPAGLAQCGSSGAVFVNPMQNHWCSEGRRVLAQDIFGNSFNTQAVICN